MTSEKSWRLWSDNDRRFVMTVYCKPKTDEVLLRELGDAESLLLLGCPICANLSYAILKNDDDSPCMKITFRGGKPQYVTKEVSRVSSLLQDKGKTVKEQVLNFPGGLCSLNDKDMKKFRGKAADTSTIVTFSCELGKEHMESRFPGKTVIGAMNAVGIFGAPIRQKLNRIYVDRDKANIKNFTLVEDSNDS
jgi:hypothetical protein